MVALACSASRSGIDLGSGSVRLVRRCGVVLQLRGQAGLPYPLGEARRPPAGVGTGLCSGPLRSGPVRRGPWLRSWAWAWSWSWSWSWRSERSAQDGCPGPWIGLCRSPDVPSTGRPWSATSTGGGHGGAAARGRRPVPGPGHPESADAVPRWTGRARCAWTDAPSGRGPGRSRPLPRPRRRRRDPPVRRMGQGGELRGRLGLVRGPEPDVAHAAARGVGEAAAGGPVAAVAVIGLPPPALVGEQVGGDRARWPWCRRRGRAAARPAPPAAGRAG
ncbi:hypothetical protein SANTM175S_09056 [Streptomyces antimycoticus]